MERDPLTGDWYLLSDDRSERKPSRFYVAALPVTGTTVGPLQLKQEVLLRSPGGSPYHGRHQGGHPPDPEALRLDPCSADLVWASEGDRRTAVVPAVYRMSRDGRLPSVQLFSAASSDARGGPRDNRSLEGLSYAPGAGSLWLSMESPLYEDGPVPTLQSGAPVRFMQLDRGGRVLREYVYEVDPIPRAAVGGQWRADNGVSDILNVDADSLWVVERAGREVADGVFRFSVRLYEARLNNATDVHGWPSLKGSTYQPLQKRLVLDLDLAVPGGVDNIEAAAWGPRLPNGNPTLVLASDDNFSAQQVTQFLAFEVHGAPAAAGDWTCNIKP